MFTKQVAMLDRLAGLVDPQVVEVLRELLGNCAAHLEHRGPVTINYETPAALLDPEGNLTSTAGAGGTALTVVGDTRITGVVSGSVRAGTAQADWEENGGDPRVSVLDPDRSPLPFWVYLPCPAHQDPAVYSGDDVCYLVDNSGVAYAPWYGSDKLGTIKLWSGNPANLANDLPGWKLCDGGAAGAGDKVAGNRPDLKGRFVVGYDNGDADYNAIGNTGGFKLHGDTENGHPDHPNHRHELDGFTYKEVEVQSGTGVADVMQMMAGGVAPWTSGAAPAADGDLPASGSIVNNGSGKCRVKVGSGHNLSVGDTVEIDASSVTAYNTTHTVTSVGADYVDTDQSYTSNADGGTWRRSENTTSWDHPGESSNDTDNRPPYYVLAYIIRVG